MKNRNPNSFDVFSFWCFAVFLLIIISSYGLPAHAAEFKSPWKGLDKGFSFVLEEISVQQFVTLFYDICEKQAVLLDPAVVKSPEKITLKTTGLSCDSTRPVFVSAISGIGFEIEHRGVFDVVRVKAKNDFEGWVELIFKPRFRDAIDLSEQVQIAVRKGSFSHQRKSAQVQLSGPSSQIPETGTNGASFINKQIDKLVFYGPPAEVKAVESLLSRLDVPTGQVEIRAGIYEYQTGKNEGSAINAAIKLFNSKLGLSINGGAQAGSSVKIGFTGIDAVLSLLDEDTRFRYVARPTVLAKDGEAVRFFSGEDVRVVGAVVLDRNGNPIQSKETLSAGVLLEATPRVRGEVVDISLYQAVSNFVATASGDPSILKRDLRSRLMMQPDAVYVIGGLKSSRRTQSQNHLFGLPVGNNDEQSETELLLLLSVSPDQPS